MLTSITPVFQEERALAELVGAITVSSWVQLKMQKDATLAYWAMGLHSSIPCRYGVPRWRSKQRAQPFAYSERGKKTAFHPVCVDYPTGTGGAAPYTNGNRGSSGVQDRLNLPELLVVGAIYEREAREN